MQNDQRGQRLSCILTPDLQLTDTVAVATQQGCFTATNAESGLNSYLL